MSISLGSWYKKGATAFCVWAPNCNQVDLHLDRRKPIPMEQDSYGYWRVEADAKPGTRYFYSLDKELMRADPASHHQPNDVHGPSEVVDHAFPWKDKAWQCPELKDLIIYELHVGTFTKEGTFDGVRKQLKRLKEFGINAIELMPVNQFPGKRNWGYDGVFPFAVQHSYGGPRALKKLIDSCHREGIAVFLDVVYNHMGPEGNYLNDFGPYFTDTYHTPWGPAMNFDQAGSDEVRRFFLDNLRYWIEQFHIDGFRVDAIHAIHDMSAYPFLREAADTVSRKAREAGRPIHFIAESDLNDTGVIKAASQGGFGFDAQWLDDFHHAIHARLTGERQGYYCDFGTTTQIAKSLRDGYVYDGKYSVFRDRRHGNSSASMPPDRFISYAQNHDQVGNRMDGERLSTLIPYERLKVASALTLLSPFVPMLFMGEEHAESNPFFFFASHHDEGLVKAVREGRAREFASFGWDKDPPDPFSRSTFNRCIINRNLTKRQKRYAAYMSELVKIRRKIVEGSYEVQVYGDAICLDYPNGFCIFTLAESSIPCKGKAQKLLLSTDEMWGGPKTHVRTKEGQLQVPADCVVVYEKR